MSRVTFPILDTATLANDLQICDFNIATVENLSKPTTEFIYILLSQIIATYSNISLESILKKLQKRSHSSSAPNSLLLPLQNDSSSIDHSKILILNQLCSSFFKEIGVSNFNLMNIYRPNTETTNILLSAVVNFAKFRQEKTNNTNTRLFLVNLDNQISDLQANIDTFILNVEKIQLYKNNQNELLEKANLNELEQASSNELDNNKNDDDNITKNNKANTNSNFDIDVDLNKLIKSFELNISTFVELNKLEEINLKQLREVQEKVTTEYSKYKTEKKIFLNDLTNLSNYLIDLTSQRDKMAKNLNINKADLVNNIEDLNSQLSLKSNDNEKLILKLNNFKTTIQTLQTFISELYDILGINFMELSNSHEKDLRLTETKSQLQKRSNKIEESFRIVIDKQLNILEEQVTEMRSDLRLLNEKNRLEKSKNNEITNNLNRKFKTEIHLEQQNLDNYITNEIENFKKKNIIDQIDKIKHDFEMESKMIEERYSDLISNATIYLNNISSRINDTQNN
ncbi:hypothetical protein TBLA_0G03150 [Henningerozyma blattae CBS 6284]|uniref:Kinetochore protein Nuf2 N-terminal domain-containing protein n=1 Tax=Henningerozyma blattae (strain ATCC 34711 / CBS 6284 / DSM 70876 / NBRC 10599 / NRRL Y-10934 / UCD 77-7) TaxID=1071380 RepID=I2H7A0_HENB6|nr:hypothetical protein TBLA_0G03150 [Tetrapisispora blattae CBS 6284]CCH62252.1 hypothetical protein TBLA_0G03150 [Tetrapisispora blattae CBS 6284]